MNKLDRKTIKELKQITARLMNSAAMFPYGRKKGKDIPSRHTAGRGLLKIINVQDGFRVFLRSSKLLPLVGKTSQSKLQNKKHSGLYISSIGLLPTQRNKVNVKRWVEYKVRDNKITKYRWVITGKRLQKLRAKWQNQRKRFLDDQRKSDIIITEIKKGTPLRTIARHWGVKQIYLEQIKNGVPLKKVKPVFERAMVTYRAYHIFEKLGKLIDQHTRKTFKQNYKRTIIDTIKKIVNTKKGR
jgi:hypothetical protein